MSQWLNVESISPWQYLLSRQNQLIVRHGKVYPQFQASERHQSLPVYGLRIVKQILKSASKSERQRDEGFQVW